MLSTEERKNQRSALYYILLTGILLVALYFIGIPFLGRFTAFVSDVGKSGKSISSTDKTPPAPPHFSNFPDFTNQVKLSLQGTSEPGASVKINFNGGEKQTLADKDGKFTFEINLIAGDNIFSAYATDQAGNVSQKTKENKIVFDTKPPDLTVTSPTDGASFFGSGQRQVTIQGTTESGAQITINDRIISVDDSGNYQYVTTLNDGENKFAVKSTDAAGNITEKDLTLNFSS